MSSGSRQSEQIPRSSLLLQNRQDMVAYSAARPDLTASASASNGQLILGNMSEGHSAQLSFPVTAVPGFTARSYSNGEVAMQFVTYLAFLVILFVLTILSALGGIFGLALVLAVLGVFG